MYRFGVIKEIRQQDPELIFHSKAVRRMAWLFGQYLGLSTEEVKDLQQAAWFHDAGKALLPLTIRLKPARLTHEEWQLMKLHPMFGAVLFQLLRESKNSVLTAIAYHHERWDGTGYPFGLKGEQIPLFARALALCDYACAVLERRPYRKRTFRPEQVSSLVLLDSASHFDPELAFSFSRFWEIEQPWRFIFAKQT